jgi:EpsI family protein
MTFQPGRLPSLLRVSLGIKHRAFAGVLLLSLLILAAYFESFAQIAGQWSDPDTRVSHGWLALAAGLAVLYVNLPRELGWSAGAGRLAGMAGVLLAGFAWLAGMLLAVESLAQVAALAVLAFAMHAVFGASIARESDRVMLVLACALPAFEGLNDLFLRNSVTVAAAAIRMLGLPIQFQGFFVVMPAGTFEIEPLCSGLQFFIAAATTAALLAAMRRESWMRTALLMVGAGVIGLLANWLRVITVILAGYFSDMQNYLVHSEHFTLGWSLFVLGIGGFVYWIGRKPVPRSALVHEPAPAAGRPDAGVWIAALLVLVAPAYSMLGAARAVMPQPPEFAAFSAPAWIGPMSSWAPWTSDAGSATRRIVADYASADGRRVSVVVARYDAPERAPELALSVSGFLPSAGWSALNREVLAMTSDGTPITARRAVLRDPQGRTWVFLHWFQVGNRYYDSALRARAAWSLRQAAGSAPPFVILIFASECSKDCVAAGAAVGTLAGAASAPLIAQMGD